MAQSIDLSGVSGEIAVTLLVIRVSPDMPAESRGCVRGVLPTAESRLIRQADQKASKMDDYFFPRPLGRKIKGMSVP